MRGQHPERTWKKSKNAKRLGGVGECWLYPCCWTKYTTWKGRRAGPCQLSAELRSIEAGARGCLVRSSQSAIDEKMGVEVGTLEGHLLWFTLFGRSLHLTGSTASQTPTLLQGDTLHKHTSLWGPFDTPSSPAVTMWQTQRSHSLCGFQSELTVQWKTIGKHFLK